ncbi:NAD-dependent epimerase/dehydratase family protein [Kribbella antibiotica]|uniref:NAD-dependent epimerase/dehydratase family protein n=1 Tax=Kribbella antibiotica TaxID=190195 RepID=A0A4R4ZIL6_9ACTN|nr:NAD(P)H-binding protein [Kribbella antibiotica]TDD58433.1 NAD-dependent epimerase/dehydratase family protein [Kribbella antibiotica]
MKIAVLGATGQTGRLLVARAVERGHEVTALVRRPAAAPWSGGVHVVQSDVAVPESVLDALAGVDVVLSGLGVAKGQDPQILSNGAELVVKSGKRVIWLGALAAGATAGALGPVNGWLLSKVLDDWEAKAVADTAVLAAGGTVVAAGMLTNKPYQGNGRLVEVPGFRRLLPPRSPRAGIAALMVAEAERAEFTSRAAVALFG